ncbi:MAG: hypothetical protein KGN84_21550 [Acidobacteriota bacterium]|nr:hypothetical protein [Acidobacteriota bacterium]
MRSTNKAAVRELIERNRWSRIGETEWSRLAASIPKLTTSDLRSAGIPVDPPWTGVMQHTIEELDASLRAFGEIYALRPGLRRFCRAEVIRAKDHARLASRNRRTDEEKRALKSEIVEWMLVWLGDPAMFPAWADLRGRQRGVRYSQPDASVDPDPGSLLRGSGGSEPH